jgi:hypothetical protein
MYRASVSVERLSEISTQLDDAANDLALLRVKTSALDLSNAAILFDN